MLVSLRVSLWQPVYCFSQGAFTFVSHADTQMQPEVLGYHAPLSQWLVYAARQQREAEEWKAVDPAQCTKQRPDSQSSFSTPPLTPWWATSPAKENGPLFFCTIAPVTVYDATRQVDTLLRSSLRTM